MKIRKLAYMNRSVKTLVYAFSFFCYSNYHHLKVILQSTPIHLTIVPFMLFADTLDVIFLAIAYHRSRNRNIGKLNELIVLYFRIVLGIVASIFSNFSGVASLAFLSPYIVVISIACIAVNNLARATIHSIHNRHLQDRSIQKMIEFEWLNGFAHTFITIAVSIVFFSTSLPLIYISSMLGVWFMLGASIYTMFQIFDPPPLLFPAKLHRRPNHPLLSYYKVLKGFDTQAIHNEQTLADAFEKKIIQLEQNRSNNYFYEKDKIEEKIHFLEESLAVINSKLSRPQKKKILEQISERHSLAFQAFFKHVSDTEALYQISQDVLSGNQLN